MPKRAISYFVISVLLFSLSVSIAGANHYNGPPLVGSCSGYCNTNSKSQSDANCWCDEPAKNTHHDYCSDYFEVCSGESQSGSSQGSSSGASTQTSDLGCSDELQNKILCGPNTANCIQSCSNENYYCVAINGQWGWKNEVDIGTLCGNTPNPCMTFVYPQSCNAVKGGNPSTNTGKCYAISGGTGKNKAAWRYDTEQVCSDGTVAPQANGGCAAVGKTAVSCNYLDGDTPIEPWINFTFVSLQDNKFIGGTLIVGKSKWVLHLLNAKPGYKATIEAYKDNNYVGTFTACQVPSGSTSCSTEGIPKSQDIGHWYEIMTIYDENGKLIKTGPIIFDVKGETQGNPSITAAKVVPNPAFHGSGINISCETNLPSIPSGCGIYPKGANGCSYEGFSVVDGKGTAKFLCTASSSGSFAIIDCYSNCAYLGSKNTTLYLQGSGQAATCIDSDGGVDYYKQGGTISKFGVTDYCSNNNQLVEYFCDSNGDLANQFYACSCNNGACVQQSTGTNPSFNFVKSDGSSADGATFIVGKDTWTFNFWGANPGDMFVIDASKDGSYLGAYEICKLTLIGFISCSVTGKPQAQDIGKWQETVIAKNADGKKIELGKISFDVKGAPTSSGGGGGSSGTTAKPQGTEPPSITEAKATQDPTDGKWFAKIVWPGYNLKSGNSINADVYTVLRKIDDELQFSEIASGDGKGTKFTDIKLDPSIGFYYWAELANPLSTYQFSVIAIKGGVSSENSNVVILKPIPQTTSTSQQTSQPTSNSCQNSCGSKSKTGSCYCDSASVVQYGDFCKDISTYCPDVWNNPNNKFKNSATGSAIKKVKK